MTFAGNLGCSALRCHAFRDAGARGLGIGATQRCFHVACTSEPQRQSLSFVINDIIVSFSQVLRYSQVLGGPCPCLFLFLYVLPSGKLTKLWKIHHLKMYFLLEEVNVHCHVSLLEGRCFSRSLGFVESLSCILSFCSTQVPCTTQVRPSKHDETWIMPLNHKKMKPGRLMLLFGEKLKSS